MATGQRREDEWEEEKGPSSMMMRTGTPDGVYDGEDDPHAEQDPADPLHEATGT